LKAAIRDPNPVIVLENEIMYGQTFPLSPEAQSKDFILPIGQAKIERSGKDITFVTHSINVGRCLEVAEQLKEKHNVEAEVINIRSAKPLDVDCIVDSVKKTNRVVSVDGGFPAYVVSPAKLCLTCRASVLRSWL
jgi:pyruvate dehydrogenase E1 component beta subunit